MKTPDDTVRKLSDVLRKRPVRRELVCPGCHGQVELRDGQYVCVDNGHTFTTLAELVAVK